MIVSPRHRSLAALVAVTALVAALLAGVSSGAAAAGPGAETAARAVSAATSPGGACAVVKRQVRKATKTRKKVRKKLRSLPTAKKKSAKARKLRKRIRRLTKRIRVAKASRKRLCRTATFRVSVSSKGAQANGDSEYAAISANDRYIAFTSEATNLVPKDTNDEDDVFVHDLVTRRTQRVNVSSKGNQANGPSDDRVSVSANGRYVAFASGASNLVKGDTNGRWDVFVRDRVKRKTIRVSVTSSGAQAMQGDSAEPAISANGRYVAFASEAANLVAKDTDDLYQVYVHDLKTRRTSLVSHAPNGTPADGRSVEPAISANGRWIAYSTEATNFGAVGDTWEPDVYVWDRKAGRSFVTSVDDVGRLVDGWAVKPSISNNGQIVAYDLEEDVLNTLGVAVTNRGLSAGDPNRFTRYGSSEAEGSAVSANGRFLTVADHPGVHLYDRWNGSSIRVDVSTTGVAGDGEAWVSMPNRNGSSVAFVSSSENLVSGDTNWYDDVFVRRR